ncbi:MAG: ankyrin repeat domain-containing protein, partial [Verrucomicrobiota bacterium]
MKTKLCIGIFLVAAAMLRAQTNDLTALLQQGLFEEQANRNLDAAIADYQSLARQFDKDRQLAATAVFRLGECYRMEGKTNEAALEYQRILRDFSDQATLATLSQQNLTGMGMAKTETGAAPVNNSNVQLWNKVKDLPGADLEKILPTLVPDSALNDLLSKRNQAMQERAAKVVDYSTNNPEISRLDALLGEVNSQIGKKINGIMQALKLRAELPASPQVATDAHQQQRDLLAKQIALAEQDLVETQKLVQVGKAVAADTRAAEREVLRLRQQLTALDAGQADLLNLSVPASSEEDQEIARIQTMIQNSPDLINASGADGNTPLNRAVFSGWLRAAGFLLDHGAALDWSALLNAASRGNKAMVEFLLERGADVNATDSNGATALHRAAASGFLSVAEVLIQHKANLEAHTSKQNEGQTPLHRAATQGHPAMVALLAAKGADVNARDAAGMTPIIRAALSGQVEVLDKLLKAGAKPDIEDDSGRTALIFAAGRANVDFVKALLAAKANPNAGKSGETPLFAAVRQPEMMKLLLSAGASPNVKTDNGGTPLLSAIQNSQFESAALLVQNGADVNTANDNGMTPLHMAVWAQNIPIISLLLSNKVDINIRHPSGRTALAMSKEAETGFRPFEPGKYGGSSRQLDQETARKISALLREHGALDNLPEWNRITVSRPAVNFSGTVFQRGTNDWNHFTLVELIFDCYYNGPISVNSKSLSFPDFGHIVIVRPNAIGSASKRIQVNLLNSTNAVDCTKDMSLEFGDTVEIPEREHTLAEKDDWIGTQIQKIIQCLRDKAGEVNLVVGGGQTIQLPLKYFDPVDCHIGRVLTSPPAQSVLTSQSDLSRVKVTRRDPKTGKTEMWILDCSNRNNQGTPDLWLRGVGPPGCAAGPADRQVSPTGFAFVPMLTETAMLDLRFTNLMAFTRL